MSDPVLLGVTPESSASATALCPPETMIVGGGGRITSGYPDHVAIAMAWPQQEPDGYVVTFIRITEIVEPEYDTYFSAYAICAKMSVAE